MHLPLHDPFSMLLFIAVVTGGLLAIGVSCLLIMWLFRWIERKRQNPE